MAIIDWIVLVGTLSAVVLYGIWRSRHIRSSENFLAGQRDLAWWTIGLSIMSTQASAITFLSTPGQAYNDGMQFAQFYFGMPLAMIVLVVFVLPIYYHLRVTTAYEYLEQRFDLRMRSLTAMLFLVQRGVAAAISIYAPSIILCAVFGWNLAFTNFLMAVFVVIYTTSGGSTAVSRTQELQMTIMLSGLVLAFILVVFNLPKGVGLSEAWQLAGITGKTQVIDWSFDWHDRYNIWSGVLGAFFLFMSYFGTDQSQVGRYLSGKSLRESRFGLLFNGFVKIPMQLLVLSVGVMVYVFFLFNRTPLHFNQANRGKVEQSIYQEGYKQLEQASNQVYDARQPFLQDYPDPAKQPIAAEQIKALEKQRTVLRQQAVTLIGHADAKADTNDKDFVFINFVLEYIPQGLVGLMLAMIFCASWSTTASELSALSATTVSDIYRRSIVRNRDDNHYLRVSKLTTVLWGVFIMVFATYADLFENLIQAVNMVGSIFYGTILGIFCTAFFLKRVGGQAVFYAAVVTQAVIIYLFFGYDRDAYLWYNPLGCFMVMGLSLFFSTFLDKSPRQA